MSAIDNAETPEGSIPSSAAGAKSTVGVGSADVARRTLTDDDIRGLIRGEIEERHEAARDLAAVGHTDRAGIAAGEAAMLMAVLAEIAPGGGGMDRGDVYR